MASSALVDRERPFEGHAGAVLAVAVGQLGGRDVIVSGGSDRTVRAWDQGTGQALLTVAGHSGMVFAVAVGRLGGRDVIVSGGDDGTVRIWDERGDPIGDPLTGHAGTVFAVAVGRLNDRDVIVSGGDDGTVRAWDKHGHPIGDPRIGHTGGVYAVAVGRLGDQDVIVSGGFDTTVRIWDASTGNARLTLAGHTRQVNAVAVGWLDDRDVVVSAGDDQTVRIWNADGTYAWAPLDGHRDWVNAVAVSPDGRFLVSGSRDGAVRTWDASTGEARLTLIGHTGPVHAVTLIPVTGEIVSVGEDGTIRVWDPTTGNQLRGAMVSERSPRQLADPVSDEPSEDDLLDVKPEVERMATLVASTGTAAPLAIALLADWGAGKSSFMAQMQKEIDRLTALSRNNPGASAYCANVRQIRFNAWHYSDDHVWAGIVEKLFEDLVKDPSPSTPDPAAAQSARDELRRKLEHVNTEQHRVAAALDRIATAPSARGNTAAAGSPLGAALTYRAAFSQVLADARKNRWTVALAAALIVIGAAVWLLAGQWVAAAGQWVAALGSTALVTAVATSTRTYRLVHGHANALRTRMQARLVDLRRQEVELHEQLAQVDAVSALSRFLDARAESPDYASYRGIISKVHTHLKQLDHHMRAAVSQWDKDHKGDPPIQRIVLYVDDLDRCPPGRVVDVLAAVHLLLALPLFIVVVGVDARWLRRSLDYHDQSLFGNTGKAAAAAPNEPMDYLDKIFQVPFALRSMNDVTARTYIRELLREPSDEPVSSGSPAGGARQVADVDHANGDPNDPEGRQGSDAPSSGASRSARVHIDQGARVDVPVLRPVSLSLYPHERDFLAELGALVGTPRAAKKLVNLYRLVRIGIPQRELTGFAGAPDSEPYRAAGLLLAVVVGTPPLATAALTAVLEAAHDTDLMTALKEASAHDRHGVTTTPAPQACSTCTDWAATLDAVAFIRTKPPGLPMSINHYQRWAPEVARFSFHTRPLWARLSPQQQAGAGTQRPD